MNRLLNRYIQFVLLLVSAFSLPAANAAPPNGLKGTSVVLVHGAFADRYCVAFARPAISTQCPQEHVC